MEMKYYLKTKEQCDEIVQRNEAFIKAERFVEGCNVCIYDYRLASLSDFVNDEAFELRGYTFVEQPDGSWERNILLNKFFNYSQTDGWMPEDLDNKEITRVQNKEDGSIISAVRFPNGKIRMKSKTSFESDQAQMAQKIYDENKNLRDFIDMCLRNKITPIFEIVGFSNQIVLSYDKDELILLQARNENGTYLSKLDMEYLTKAFNMRIVEDYNIKELEKIASKYSEEEAIEKIGDKKFQSLDEMLEFLSN